MNLANKRVLFIGPIFHDYHILIKAQLEEFGAIVDFFPERKYGLTFKIVNNLLHKNLYNYQKKHYDQIYNKISISTQSYDYLFVIRGYLLPPYFVEKIKIRYKNINTILYQWDAIKDNNYSSLLNSFNIIYTFDYADSKDLNVPYLPLFYTNEIENIRLRKNEVKYDLFFMCWYTQERYNSLLVLIDYCKKQNISIKAFVYIPTLSFIKEQLLGNKIDTSIVSFKPLKRAQYLELLASSLAIVDFSKKNQSGLAIRIIEAVGAGKKILTNSKDIVKESFYREDYIKIIDQDNLQIESNFLIESNIDSEYESKIQNYSIGNWIENCFNNRKNE
jgi:hypothetical protein